MTKQPQGYPYGRGQTKIAVALPTELFEWVKAEAIRNNRTFSQEIAACVATAKICVTESDAIEEPVH